MVRWGHAVDSSYDLLTREEALCLRQKGVDLYIQCLLALPRSGPDKPQQRVQSLVNAHAEGLRTAAYIVVGSRERDYVGMAREGVPDEVWARLDFADVDVEVPDVSVDRVVIPAIEAVQRLGTTALIYANYQAWTSFITPRNDTRLAARGVKLHRASWDGEPDVDNRLLFGGWAVAGIAVEQYTGGENRCGQFVDRNVVDLDWLEGLRRSEEDEMPLKVIKGSKDYTYATNGVQKWLIPNQEVLRQLRDAGILDKETQPLSDEAVNAIPTIKQ
ncbi:MAG: hypothetical protein WEE64_01025 [Dehalococcoidia bacterium]